MESARAFRAEILLTSSLRHPNIINFVGACWSRDLICMVMYRPQACSSFVFLETILLAAHGKIFRL